jgi:hypothetical protein
MKRRITLSRWIALGALIGLAVALAFSLAMPTRRLHRAYIPAPHGQRVAVYGELAPYAPARFSVATEQQSPRVLRDALLGLIAGGLAAAALGSVGRTRAERGGL